MSENPLQLIVHRMTWEAEGVLSAELTHPDGKPLPAWTPGAHIDVHIGGHIRQYSLCGDPHDQGTYRIGVLNEPSSRGGSRFVHTQLRPGQSVTVSAPRNHFALEDAASYVFVAGGIGITPSSRWPARPPAGAPGGAWSTAGAAAPRWPSPPNSPSSATM